MATRLGSVSMLALLASTLTLLPAPALAQLPATYDFDENTPGVQGPTSPLVANPFTHFFRTVSLNVPLLVPTADLQATLPPGFVALSDGQGRSTVNFLFSFQVTDAEVVPSTPYHTLVLQTAARNTSLNRIEVLVLGRFNSSQATVDGQNATTGGGVYLADFEWEIGQKNGELDVRVEIESPGVGLKLRAVAKGSADLSARTRFDPNPSPFRFVNAGVALDSFFLASVFDARVVLSTATNVSVTVNNGRILVPGGSWSVLGVGASFTFSKDQVVYLDFE
jgi:hypothetical protein